MTAVSVTNSNNQVDPADTTTGYSSDGGGGAGPQNEPDFVYQRTSGTAGAVSRKVGTTKGGHAYTAAAITMTAAGDNRVWMAKGVWSNNSALQAAPSACHRVGDSSSAHYEYNIRDNGTQGDIDADPKELYVITPIDPNVAAWPDTITGSPTFAPAGFFGIQGYFTGSAKAENVAIDAIDVGDGLWMTGGTSPDPAGKFDDFVSHDEGTFSNRFGHVSTIKGIIQVFGTLSIGRTAIPTASATVFSDSGQTLIFPKGFYDAGWTGLLVDLGNASTDIDFTSVTFIGQGQNDQKYFFDTIDEIAANVITLAGDSYITGTPVRYSNEGGSDTIGLTSGNLYWVRRTAANSVSVYPTRADARANTNVITLSDGSTGESHSLTREPDIRPDLTVVSTSGAFDATGCRFESFRQIVTTSGATFTNCTIVLTGLVDLTTNSGATLDSCVFSGATTNPGEALVQADTLANISSCSFTASTGHAIEIDTAGTYAFSGNTFTGYGPDGATFNASTGVSGSTITTDAAHGFSDGDEVYYNDEGGTTITELTDGARYFANSITTTTLSLHNTKQDATSGTNAISLTSGSSETHTLYSGNAAIYNSSGGSVTVSVTGGVASPTIRNGVGASTTVTNNINVTVTVIDSEANPIPGAQVAIFRTSDDATLLSSTSTDENGEVATTAASNYGAIYIRIRQSTNDATFDTSQAFTSEVVTTDATHTIVDGEAVVYSKDGGTAAVGLTDGDTYYVNNLSSTTLSLHTSAANAIADTSRVNLTTNGTETHILNPVRYIPNSTVGTIGTTDFSVTVTLIADTTVTG